MQDDALDKLLKDAAAQYHPGYNDRAWEGMRQLLDNKLPQEKDRQRIWPWLLLPLLATFVAAGVVWWNSNKKQPDAAVTAQPAPGTSGQPIITAVRPATIDAAPAANAPQPVSAATIAQSSPANTFTPPIISPSGKPSSPDNKVGGFRSMITIYNVNADDINDLDRARNKKAAAKTTVTVTPPATGAMPQTEQGAEEEDKAPPVKAEAKTNAPAETIKQQEKPTAKTEQAAPAGEKPPAENPATTASAQKSRSSKKSSRFADNIALTVSAGPDYSFVKTNQPGQVQPAYGAGLAYTFANRFTVRAGYYAARKVYTTDSSSYKPKMPLSTYYTNIQKIEGDCMVHEIPISLSYSFGAKGRRQWFAGAGISTLIMKRETYTYYYYRNNTLVSRNYTLNNENEHRFSILTLSGGYQYRLSNRVSLAAEPYLKLPLSGIGFGNLRLNSGGVLVSAVVSPFRKKNK